LAINTIFFDLGNTLVTNAGSWFTGAKEVLTALKSKGFRLGIISNTGNLTRPDILELLPADFLLTDFEPSLVLFSSEVGLAKPDPAIFMEAARRANVPPEACMYCSENPVETNAAQQTGMIAIRVHFPPIVDLNALKQRIEELDVPVNPNTTMTSS
jgi:bacterial leucyl aminopeptidase